MSSHLYNGFDRSLPSAFHERTLDFYVTLCHRLMRLNTSLPEEMDDLLGACWSLVEMLFQIRQDQREDKLPDEEVWGSAVQACWDLCDLFREGWTQGRPERTTPRPTLGSSLQSQSSAIYSGRSSPSAHEIFPGQSFLEPPPIPPETPTTIFDDTNESLEEADPQILVLGPEQSSTSSNSNMTSVNISAMRTSVRPSLPSTAPSSAVNTTPPSAVAEANLARLRILLLKAATKGGYNRQVSATTAAANNTHLLGVIAQLPPTVFGTHAAAMDVLERYKKLVAAWPAFCRRMGGTSAMAVASLTPTAGAGSAVRLQQRATAAEVARGVQGVVARAGERYAWLGDLFRIVVGCRVDDENAMRGVEVIA